MFAWFVRMKGRFAIIQGIVLLLTAALASGAQSLVEVRGTVVDEAGALIPGANVVIDDGRGRRFSTQSDELGRYRFAAVAPGSYTLTATAAGFAPLTRPAVIKTVQVQTLDLSLEVVISEQIEVKSDEAGVSTEPDRNLSAVSLTEDDLAALPDDRDEMLAVLQSLAGPGEDAPLFVDGFADDKLPPKESIQAVRINTNPFSAAFDGAGGGNRIEIITRPGSDRTRGSVRFLFNDESLNARHAAALRRAPLQVRDLRAQMGGPLIRRKWDYYIEVELEQQDENAFINATILDPQTLAARPFQSVVLTPQRERELALRTNYLAGERHTLGLRYNAQINEARGQGLGGGFDLPERAFNQTAKDKTVRASLTSILSGRSLNELRATMARRDMTMEADSLAPATVVLDAFYSGGNQGARFRNNRRDWIEINNQFSYTRERHAVKAGLELTTSRWAQINQSNYGGSFTFGGDFDRDLMGAILTDAQGRPTAISSLEHYRRTLAGLPGYRPSQFSIVRGDPLLDFRRTDGAWFAQDDWRLKPHLTLSFGLRHQLQSDLDDRFNFSPRAAVAWSPGANKRSVLRAGVGIFYDRIGPELTIEALRLDGVRQQQFIVRQPAFYLDIPPDLGGAEQIQSTIRTRASDLDAPRLVRANMSYEREIGKGIVGALSYQSQRGYRRLRTRNVNAPLPDGGGRPQPERGPVLQYESTGLFERHELQASWRYRYKRRVNLFGNYVLASAFGDTDGTGSVPADSYDLAAEWGRAASDQRHTFTLGGSVTLPGRWTISPMIRAATGRPFNITTGRDRNGDAIFTDRPAFAAPNDPEAIRTGLGSFLLDPRPGDEIIPRNYGRGPGFVNADLNTTKTFAFGPKVSQARQGRNSGDADSRYRVVLGANVRNILNHTNPAGISGVLASPRFGAANRALAARRITLSLALNF